ncbi:MAG: hypothetical protein HN742_42065 [Lentisphaerae bacterium]|jgi:hypothetical protein|nr:hypothetical protein [Lentisphaerota bacterium]MBT4822117.1 hypothetical protein [Lentisphaerota bacterium]MBT7057970.1 hypothetical protein [Lentisphaerota bacterium]MBT7848525.1 hypothetical protein [Lentisphaerota bacterium]
MDEKHDPQPVAPSASPELAPRMFFLLAAAALLIRTASWLQADLWYDEVIALTEFVVGPPRARGILWPLRFYPIPNNHILFSAISWCWLRICRYNVAEALLRLPSICFALAAFGVIIVGWRRWLGGRLAGITAVAFAVSPVFSAFAYQYRGYSLTMLLATLGVMATMDILDGHVRRGTLVHAVVALLLPLVIPTNALLTATHLAFLAWEAHRRNALRRILLPLGIIAGAGALGASYYLTIWPQFTKALQQTAGWESPLSVLLNVSLASLAHLGPLPLICLWQAGVSVHKASPGAQDSASRQAVRLIVACLLPMIALLVCTRSAPFPRVFLVFLPTVSFAVVRSVVHLQVWRSKSLLLVLGLVVMHAFVWERVCTWLTNKQVMDGRHPQNLLQQHYRGSTALQEICSQAKKDDLSSRLVVLTSAHDFPTFRHYWLRFGGSLETVIAENSDLEFAVAKAMQPGNRRLSVVAANEVEAARLFGLIGITETFASVYYEPFRGLYVLAPPPGRRPPAP